MTIGLLEKKNWNFIVSFTPSRRSGRRKLFVRTVGSKQYYYAFLVNYSEAGTVIYIQRAQEEICAFFSGRHEAPIVRAVMRHQPNRGSNTARINI